MSWHWEWAAPAPMGCAGSQVESGCTALVLLRELHQAVGRVLSCSVPRRHLGPCLAARQASAWLHHADQAVPGRGGRPAGAPDSRSGPASQQQRWRRHQRRGSAGGRCGQPDRQARALLPPASNPQDHLAAPLTLACYPPARSIVLPTPFRDAALQQGGPPAAPQPVPVKRAGGVLRDKYGRLLRAQSAGAACARSRSYGAQACFLRATHRLIAAPRMQLLLRVQSAGRPPARRPSPHWPACPAAGAAGKYRTLYDQRARTTVLVNVAGVLERCNEQTLPALYKARGGQLGVAQAGS